MCAGNAIWLGIAHRDANGMIAILARESGEYAELARGGEGLRVVVASS